MESIKHRNKPHSIKRKLTFLFSDTTVKEIDISLFAKDILQELRKNI